MAAVAYQRQALARSRDGVLSVEDVIIHKLIAWATEWEVADRWRSLTT